MLSQAEVISGHNAQVFDIPSIRRLHPKWIWNGRIFDTFRITKLIWTDLQTTDAKLARVSKDFPSRLIGSQGLEAWGHRLGILKGDFGKTTDWKDWSPQMQRYCEKDVDVTEALLLLIEKQAYSKQSMDLEHEFQFAITDMENHGVAFDEAAAASLYATLAQRLTDLRTTLEQSFEPNTKQLKTKVKTWPFNPGSRIQVADRLKKMGWVPTSFTPTGQAEINDEILSSLTIPAALPLAEYYTVAKRISQLADGESAWLKAVKAGRIHGEVNTNGAVTGRCTHFRPNLAQVPKVGSPYGTECRGLFVASPGMLMVGADASGLELRMLSHYLARFDGGAYGKLVLEGDVHTFNQGVFGLAPGKPGRDISKTGIYALIYGSGDENLGATLVLLAPDAEKEAQSQPLNRKNKWVLSKGQATPARIANMKRGQYARARIFKLIPAFQAFVDSITKALETRPYLIGLDGRKLHIRSKHSAPNTVLQSAGAMVVKKATCLAVREYKRLDAHLLLHIHDEMQSECPPDNAQELGKVKVAAIRQAGVHFNLRIPTDGEFKVGRNWAETH